MLGCADQSLNLAWLPRVDGVILKSPPFEQIARGEYAQVRLSLDAPSVVIC
jgi:hypothetical protein